MEKTSFGASVFRNGKRSIDHGAGCAYLGDEALKLTHIYLTDMIWGSDIASLRVHMATLRKKVEKALDAEKRMCILFFIKLGVKL